MVSNVNNNYFLIVVITSQHYGLNGISSLLLWLD